MRGLVALGALAASLFAATTANAQVARFSTGNDTLMPDASTVRIESGYVPGDGLVIVRAVRGSKIAPASLGQATVAPGEFTDLRVRLTRPVRPGEKLIVMLHADYGQKGVYDGDPVVLSVDIPTPVVARAASRG